MTVSADGQNLWPQNRRAEWLAFRFCSFYSGALRIMEENKNRGVAKRWLGVVAILALICRYRGLVCALFIARQWCSRRQSLC